MGVLHCFRWCNRPQKRSSQKGHSRLTKVQVKIIIYYQMINKCKQVPSSEKMPLTMRVLWFMDAKCICAKISLWHTKGTYIDQAFEIMKANLKNACAFRILRFVFWLTVKRERNDKNETNKNHLHRDRRIFNAQTLCSCSEPWQ